MSKARFFIKKNFLQKNTRFHEANHTFVPKKSAKKATGAGVFFQPQEP